MIRNLGLDSRSTRLECAKARNEFTRSRIKADFQAGKGTKIILLILLGLEEMVANAGGTEILRDFYLPVFT